MTNTPDYHVPALARGLLILEMFDREHRILTTQDFADALHVSSSATYRIVQTLLDMGYLRKVTRNAYELGPQVLSRGFSFLASRDLVDVAAPHLNALRDRTSISCHLSVRDGRDSLYIYRAQASQRLSVNIPLGTRIPCSISAMGRILLSALNELEINTLYQNAQLDNYPKPFPQNLPELKARIKTEREQGYASNHSDNAIAIACPLVDHTGKVVAAINASGPDPLMNNPEQFELIKQSLFETAIAISRELGASLKAERHRMFW